MSLATLVCHSERSEEPLASDRYQRPRREFLPPRRFCSSGPPQTATAGETQHNRLQILAPSLLNFPFLQEAPLWPMTHRKATIITLAGTQLFISSSSPSSCWVCSSPSSIWWLTSPEAI